MRATLALRRELLHWSACAHSARRHTWYLPGQVTTADGVPWAGSRCGPWNRFDDCCSRGRRLPTSGSTSRQKHSTCACSATSRASWRSRSRRGDAAVQVVLKAIALALDPVEVSSDAAVTPAMRGSRSADPRVRVFLQDRGHRRMQPRVFTTCFAEYRVSRSARCRGAWGTTSPFRRAAASVPCSSS